MPVLSRTTRLQWFQVGALFFGSGLTVAITLPSQAIALLAPMARTTVAPTLTLARQAEAELATGRQLYGAGRFAEAAAAWEVAAQTYGNRDDRPNQALSLSSLSLAYQALGQWEAAKAAIDQSLALLRATPTVDAILWAQALNTQAGLLLETDSAQAAVETWQQAHRFYLQAGDPLGAIGSQVNQAQAWQQLGFYRRSRQTLEQVNRQLAAAPDSAFKVRGLRSLGVALQVVGDLAQSHAVLTQSLAIAQAFDLQTEISPIWLSLGNVAIAAGDSDTALNAFIQAEQTATQPRHQLNAGLNRLSLLADLGQGTAALALIPPLQRQLATLPPSRTTVHGTVNLAEQILKLDQQPNSGVSARALGLDQWLPLTVATARQLADPRAQAYALGQWGQLSAQTGQPTTAARLTQQALTIAQRLQADDLVYPLAWQLGQIQVQRGERTAAIATYTEATQALQALRGDLVAINPDVQFSFRKSVEPVYRQLVALLLASDPTQANLQQAQSVMEALQLAELDNFFREACLDVEPVDLNQLDPSATVIYPIILPDHLAVIVSPPGQPLQYYRIEQSQAQVEQVLDQLLSSLSPAYDNRERLRYSQQLYDWLIRPAEADQLLQAAQTLVFVLDGPFRDVPMAALYDGTQYLLEKYSVALSPGLQLVAARPFTSQQFTAIAAGMSQARPGFTALPAVESEVQKIADQLPASVLLNQAFTSDRLAQTVARNPAEIIHLATHLQFSSNVDETFLLTWEGKLNARDLTQLLTSRETAQAGAIELLVLSACQTAAGDDRAVLGLAGVAIRSGARSTLATLWTVNDQSTAQFMAKFYQYLQQPNVTKAEAVRQAQLSLLADHNYQDPFFWAPFVLVGNWL